MYLARCLALDLVAVLTEYWFPDTPATGDVVELVPLAGNGYTAPHSYYAFDISADGVVGGGNLDIQVRFDERYTSIVPYLEVRTNSISANVTGEWILASTAVDRVVQGPFSLVFDAAQASNQVFEPPPLIIQGAPRETLMTYPWFRFRTVNVDTEDYQIFGRVYNFKIDALKVIGLPALLAVLPR